MANDLPASDPHVQQSKKIWVPLENNPTVMTKLAHRLGLSQQLEFVDVFSVTDEDLLAMVPKPVHALLWLFPITPNSEEALKEENDAMQPYEAAGPDEPVLWYEQTIGHACGSIGLLHCITNGPASQYIAPDSELQKLVDAATPLRQRERAQLLYDSEVFERFHKEAAEEGDSIAPSLDNVNFGFTAFVRGKDGHLYELEGRRKGPVDRGVLDEDEDLLSERVLGLSIFPYINREKLTESGFSCIALVNAEV